MKMLNDLNLRASKSKQFNVAWDQDKYFFYIRTSLHVLNIREIDELDRHLLPFFSANGKNNGLLITLHKFVKLFLTGSLVILDHLKSTFVMCFQLIEFT